MRLIRELSSHLQYKIILPFLILTMVVALLGSALAFFFISSTAQERLNNQLAQITRNINDKLSKQESDNLLFLREIAFAQANPQAKQAFDLTQYARPEPNITAWQDIRDILQNALTAVLTPSLSAPRERGDKPCRPLLFARNPSGSASSAARIRA